MSCPHPTPQYGQTERATSASSIRACIARVLSDIASTPVPSVHPRIWRMSGHLESKPVKDGIGSPPRSICYLHCCHSLFHGKAQKIESDHLIACHRLLIL